MANHASSKKRIRQTAKRTVRNRHVRATVRSLIRKCREAIKSGNSAQATATLKAASMGIESAVTKGIFHRNTASRYVSRLASQVAKLA